MAVYDIPPYVEPPSILTGMTKLPRNPQLPQTPLGAYTDSQYEAAEAQNKAAYQRKYADLMRQLGYVDPHTGQVIKGDIESEADVQRALLAHDQFYAGIDTINQAQNEGNFFSGYQAQRFAKSQYPYITQIAQITADVGKRMAQAQEDASSALSDYILQRNIELADAAARAAERERNNPPPADAGGKPWFGGNEHDPPGSHPGGGFPIGRPPVPPFVQAPSTAPPEAQMPMPYRRPPMTAPPMAFSGSSFAPLKS